MNEKRIGAKTQPLGRLWMMMASTPEPMPAGDDVKNDEIPPGMDKPLTFVQVASTVISIVVSDEVDDGN